jgi:thiol-disulfide isomerase/thioredoxin
MTTDPTPSARGRQFSGKAVLAVVGAISLVMCAIVVILSQRGVTRALDQRSHAPAAFEHEVVESEAHPVADDEPGWWRCGLVISPNATESPNSPGFFEQEIPFFLWLPAPDDDRSAYIRNGYEYIPVDSHSDDNGAELRIDFPHFDSRITATLNERGDYAGQWTKTRPSGDSTMPFYATRKDGRSRTSRFPGGIGRTGASNTDLFDPVSQRWKIDFDQSGPAVGRFHFGAGIVGPEISEQEATGTILTPTGDYRYLAGVLDTAIGIQLIDRLNLSVFDGAHAFLLQANINRKTGAVTGDFYSGATWHETFTATRLAPGEGFDLPDPFSEVALKPGETRLHLPMLDDPKYAGKPVIVEVMGTWCPNCHDANRLLVELYAQRHAEGLEILGLAYEHTEDEARSLKQIDRFKQHIGATWDIIPAGVSDKAKTAATLPALTDIKSYPTTIFLNRDHTVEAIHSGFNGPATGPEYDKTREEFARHIKKILSSK